MSSPNAARLRIIRRLAAGLDPSDADIDEFHEGEIGLFDEPDEIASGTSDVSRNEQPSLIHVSQASTWYKRVGLGNYLRNTPVVPFLNLVKEPVESGGDIEAAAQAIWNALAGVVRVGEQVIAHSGRFVREKAAQIHLDQKPRRPLEALRDADELRLWAEPWQRVLMFFVRTQTSDNWQSHWYRFTIRQQSSWDGLWQAAHKYQGMEEDTSTFQMNPLQRACLGFCVELLGQSYQTSAFECPLVCAWAALGYDEEGWLPLSTYVDVLSKAIRTGQNFVFHLALLSGSDSKRLFTEMERRKAGNRWGETPCEVPSRSNGPETCMEWLDAWLKTTSVVGTKTPMDWMVSVAVEI